MPFYKNLIFFKLPTFWGEKPLEMGPDFQKFQESSQISYFLREKNLYTCG